STRQNSSLDPDRRADLKPLGAWNEMVIEVRGDWLQVWVNGHRILSQDLDRLADGPGAKPGLRRASGRIGFQQHTGEVRFRHIEIKELPPPEKVGEVRRLGGHTESVWGVAFAPGGRLAATGGGHSVGADGRPAPGGKPASDFDIRLWDRAEGREIGRFEGHTGGVGRLAFSPDGKRLASAGGGGERTIRLWDVATRQQLACLKGHEDVVTGIAFTPDGHRLLSAGWGSRL